jgi:hypothetical protein
MQTYEEWRRLAFSPDGSDTTAGIDDAELALAIKGTGDLMDAAELLTEVHGHIVARNDIAARVEVSPELPEAYRAYMREHMRRRRAAERWMSNTAEARRRPVEGCRAKTTKEPVPISRSLSAAFLTRPRGGLQDNAVPHRRKMPGSRCRPLELSGRACR